MTTCKLRIAPLPLQQVQPQKLYYPGPYTSATMARSVHSQRRPSIVPTIVVHTPELPFYQT